MGLIPTQVMGSIPTQVACRHLCGFLDGVAPDPFVGFPSGFVVKVSIQVPFVPLASLCSFVS